MTTMGMVLGGLALLLALPFYVLVLAKLTAYGWYRGKSLFNKESKSNGEGSI